MSYKISELRKKSVDKLIEEHDRLSEHTVVGTDYYLQELARRDTARQTDTMLRFTDTIRRLTWTVVVLTAANVALVAWEVLS